MCLRNAYAKSGSVITGVLSAYLLCNHCVYRIVWLPACREQQQLLQQQQQNRKQGSPLSKWRKGSTTPAAGSSSAGGKPAVSNAAPATPSAGSGSSIAGAATGEAASYSPVTSQLPAVRTPGTAAAPAAPQQQWADDDTNVQVGRVASRLACGDETSSSAPKNVSEVYIQPLCCAPVVLRSCRNVIPAHAREAC